MAYNSMWQNLSHNTSAVQKGNWFESLRGPNFDRYDWKSTSASKAAQIERNFFSISHRWIEKKIIKLEHVKKYRNRFLNIKLVHSKFFTCPRPVMLDVHHFHWSKRLDDVIVNDLMTSLSSRALTPVGSNHLCRRRHRRHRRCRHRR